MADISDARLMEIADAHNLSLGMYPPMQLADAEPGFLKFVRPAGLTYYGENILAFGRAIAKEAARG